MSGTVYISLKWRRTLQAVFEINTVYATGPSLHASIPFRLQRLITGPPLDPTSIRPKGDEFTVCLPVWHFGNANFPTRTFGKNTKRPSANYRRSVKKSQKTALGTNVRNSVGQKRPSCTNTEILTYVWMCGVYVCVVNQTDALPDHLTRGRRPQHYRIDVSKQYRCVPYLNYFLNPTPHRD